jgi:predicted nucleic acid-binding protein
MFAKLGQDAFLVDTFAWREYFVGGQKGAQAAEVIDLALDLVPKYTHTLCLAELVRVYHNSGGDFERDLPVILGRSHLVDHVSKEVAIRSGRLRNQLAKLTKVKKGGKHKSPGICTVDCVLLAMAIEKGVRLISGGSDFEVISHPDRFMIKSSDLDYSEEGKTIQLPDYIYLLEGD